MVYAAPSAQSYARPHARHPGIDGHRFCLRPDSVMLVIPAHRLRYRCPDHGVAYGGMSMRWHRKSYVLKKDWHHPRAARCKRDSIEGNSHRSVHCDPNTDPPLAREWSRELINELMNQHGFRTGPRTRTLGGRVRQLSEPSEPGQPRHLGCQAVGQPSRKLISNQ